MKQTEKDQTEFNNKRKHSRHAVPEGSFILCRNIAGQVLDISEGGMSIKLADSSGLFSDETNLKFTCRSTIEDFDRLSLKLVRRGKFKLSAYGGYATQTIGVVFINTDEHQQKQIQQHISNLLEHQKQIVSK